MLDVMLPDIDGFQLCQKIRQLTAIRILFLTARSSDLDKMTGLGHGYRQVIGAHQGSIDVESKVGQGTTITIQLPLSQGQ
ncbi:response regulator [Paenibacillus sp. 1P07SE]|uniref:response regulator n=1 Tax=Paenibacillus sp. 1P07SE TaxID=3132209 RepID=UPI0039A72B49